MKPSRLHRRLSPFQTPIFEVKIGAETFTDDDIHEISIHRGTSGAAPSFTPTTASISVPGRYRFPKNATTEVSLTPSAVSRFAEDTGVPLSGIADRFNGRRGDLSINDVAWRHGIAGKSNSQITASSWSAISRRSTVAVWATAGTRLGIVLVDVLQNDPEISALQPISRTVIGRFDALYEDEYITNFGDAITKYGTGLGTHFQHTRAGGINVLPIGVRRDRVATYLDTKIPFLRSHTTSPATWTTSTDESNKTVGISYWLPDGSPRHEYLAFPGDRPPGLPQVEELDFTHIIRSSSDDTIGLVSAAKNYELNSSLLKIQEVNFDLIRLLSSDAEVDRIVGAQLLQLQEGDPVYLGGDWPPEITGAYFANAIEEKITPDQWEIKLSIFPAVEVVGSLPAGMPGIPALVWAQANHTWADAPDRWNGA